MWVSMANKKGENPKIKPEQPKEKGKFFPKLTILFGLFLIAVAGLSFFNIFSFPPLVTEIVWILAGLWLLKLGIEKGFYGRRKEVLKKYI